MRPFRGRAQAYFMLDEMLLAGELQEPSKKAVTRVIEVQDQLVEAAKQGGGAVQGVGLAGVLWTPHPLPCLCWSYGTACHPRESDRGC